MNQVIIIGNLTKDPEVRYTTGQNQTAICRFTVAVNDRYGGTSYIPVVAFGKQGENCGRFLAKGRKAAISGRIQTGSYTNRDGQKVYTTDVIANNVEFLGGQEQRERPTQEYVNDQPAKVDYPDMPAGFQQMADSEQIPF